MLGSSPGCEPRVPGLRAWPHWVLWRLGGLLCLLGLEGAFCLAGPGSSPPAVSNNNEGVNVYMRLEEVKKFLDLSLFCFLQDERNKVLDNWMTWLVSLVL
ncbi:unnamed protein product [Arctogadus glacialis]